MFEGDVFVFDSFENLASEALFRVHHRLFDGDDAEALLACDAGDDAFAVVNVRVGDDHRTGVGRVVRVADVDRNSGETDGEDRIFVENARAHVGQFAQFTIGDVFDPLRIVNDARVGHQESVDVGPVFVEIGFHSACHDGTGDVGTAAGERADGAVRHGAVESRNYAAFVLLQLVCQKTVGRFRVKRAVVLELDVRCGVDEIKAEILCEDHTVQVFPAACRVVTAGMMEDRPLDVLIFVGQIIVETETFNDEIVAFADLIKNFVNVSAGSRYVITFVKHIRDLGVSGETLAGSGRDNVLSGVFRLNDIGNFYKLFRAGERTAAEFYNLYIICFLVVHVKNLSVLNRMGVRYIHCITLYYMKSDDFCQCVIFTE